MFAARSCCTWLPESVVVVAHCRAQLLRWEVVAFCMMGVNLLALVEALAGTLHYLLHLRKCHSCGTVPVDYSGAGDGYCCCYCRPLKLKKKNI